MVYRNFLPTVLLALALAPLACGGAKAKDKTPDEIQAEEKAKPPPPPPKCESLEENCAAKSDTVVKIQGASLQFKPTEKWKYAQADEYSIMQASADGAALALGSYTPDKDAKKNDAAREAAFADLLKAMNVTAPKGMKVNWKKSENPLMEPNGLKISSWIIAPGGERGGVKDKKSQLWIMHAPIDATHAMLGIGFVLEEDVAGQEAIPNALMTIKPDDSDEKAEGDKKPEGDKK